MKHGRWYHLLCCRNALSRVNSKVVLLRLLIFINLSTCIIKVVIWEGLLSNVILYNSRCHRYADIIILFEGPLFFKKILKRISYLRFLDWHILLLVILERIHWGGRTDDKVRILIVIDWILFVVVNWMNALIFTLPLAELRLNNLLLFIIGKILMLGTILDLSSPVRHDLILPIKRISSRTIRHGSLRFSIRIAKIGVFLDDRRRLLILSSCWWLRASFHHLIN